MIREPLAGWREPVTVPVCDGDGCIGIGRIGTGSIPPPRPSPAGWTDLMHPHPDLGRDGPVCPFVRAGVAHGLLWAGLATGGDGLGSVDLRRIVDDALEQYRDLSAEHPDRDRKLALVTLFPGLTRYERIDAAHLAGKSDAVRHGAMLGQFYPGCGVPGLWNRDFRPLYAYFTHLAPDLPRRLRWAIANRMPVEGAAVADIAALRAHTRDEHAR